MLKNGNIHGNKDALSSGRRAREAESPGKQGSREPPEGGTPTLDPIEPVEARPPGLVGVGDREPRHLTEVLFERVLRPTRHTWGDKAVTPRAPPLGPPHLPASRAWGPTCRASHHPAPRTPGWGFGGQDLPTRAESANAQVPCWKTEAKRHTAGGRQTEKPGHGSSPWLCVVLLQIRLHVPVCSMNCFSFCSFSFFLFSLGPHLRHKDIPRLGGESEV